MNVRRRCHFVFLLFSAMSTFGNLEQSNLSVGNLLAQLSYDRQLFPKHNLYLCALIYIGAKKNVVEF